MVSYTEFTPDKIKTGWVDDDGNLKKSCTTDSYTGGDPASAADLKRSIVYADGRLKEGLLDGDALAESVTGAYYPDISGYGDFDGSDYIALGTQLGLVVGGSVTAFSIAAWIYPTSGGQFRILADTDASGGLLLTRSGDNYAFFSFNDGTASHRIALKGDTLIANDAWTHIIATHDGSETLGGMAIYLGGALESSSDLSAGSYAAIDSTAMEIGAWQRLGTPSYATGRIKDVRVYSKVLSTDERAKVFLGQDVTDSLTARYPLQADATDASGNGNDGTNNGVTFV